MSWGKNSAAARTWPPCAGVSGKFDVADAIQFEELMKLGPRELETRVIPFLKLARGIVRARISRQRPKAGANRVVSFRPGLIQNTCPIEPPHCRLRQ